MHLRGCYCFVLCFILACGCAKPKVQHERESGVSDGQFFVATNGNDSWSGLLATPNGRRSDGPLATVGHAVWAAREWRRNHPETGNCTVTLRGGNYFQEKTLTLGPQDSGLTIAAYGEEHPIISGGRRIEGWKETEVGGRKLWMAELGDERRDWMFRELWVNGRRAIRARHPNQGYLPVAGLKDSTPDWTQGQARFVFKEGDVPAWPGLTNAEVVVMSRWVESRLPIVSVDKSQHLLSFGKRSVFQLGQGDPYYIEGALEALDEPGEWCLQDGTVYYMARVGEKLDAVEAIAPVLDQVVRIDGEQSSAKGDDGSVEHAAAGPAGRDTAAVRKNYVEAVTFRGLTFSHTEWYFPLGFHSGKKKPTVSPEPQPEVGGFAQAAIGVPGAVMGEGLRNCVFTNCVFGHLGSYALELGRGCQSNVVAHCEFFDLGAGGLKLGETAQRKTSDELARANEIVDCEIRDGGKMFASGEGIWIGQSPDNVLLRNRIHDFFYTGISIGWTWGYGPALASNNLVAFNHVHHIGAKADGDGPILSDMGGIYTLGKQPGTRIINNVWHDIAALHYGGWGIYFDEGSSGILAQSNVVYRTTHGGFHQHYGETNMVWNNIFAFGRDAQIQRTRAEPHNSFSFKTNIVYFDSGTLLTGDWSGDNYTIDWNVYFDTRDAAGGGMKFAGATLEEWRKRGHDVNSVIADPGFVAPKREGGAAERVGR